MAVDLTARHAPNGAADVPAVPGPGGVVTVLRVAFLLEQAWHRVPGGTAVAAAQSARALAGRDDVEIVGLTARHRSDNLPAMLTWAGACDEVDVDGGPVAALVASRLPRWLLYEGWHRVGRPRVDRLVGRTGRAPDVVHASGGAVPATRAPLVATVHDLAWRRHPAAATNRGRRLFEGWLADAQRAERVVCPSKATRDELLGAGFDGDRIRIVPLGVSLAAAESGLSDRLRTRHGLDGPFVLWVGTLEPRKNLNRLVTAMSTSASLADVPLVLVGPEGWRTDVARIVAPLEDRVVVVGSVSEAEKRAWFEAADVFCLPSLHEGFGLPVLEAMAHGTPVVTSSGTATEEVVGNGGLTVDPTDGEAIADALATVLGDSLLAERLGEAGRARAADHSWSRTADGLVATYREAIG